MIEDGPGTPPEGSPEWTPPGAPPEGPSAWHPQSDGSSAWPPAPLPAARKSRLPYMIALAIAGVVVLVLATTAGVLALRPRPSHRSLLSITQPSPPSPLPEECVSGRTCPWLQAAEHSILRITTYAPGCQRTLIGTGFVYAPHKILTNAHVVAGAAPHSISVTDFTGKIRRATLVGYDPERDVAVLDVAGLPLAALHWADGPEIPSQGTVAGYLRGGGLSVQSVGILPPRYVEGPDIYQRGLVERQILQMRASIVPGESGSPVLDRDGHVIGLAFAEALDLPSTGYGLPLAELVPQAETAARATTPVSAQGCSD
jgi:S1-C subfamily serine protease